MPQERFYHPDYLMHYGVLGMKWGRRKSPQQLQNTISRQRKKLVKYGKKREKFSKKKEKYTNKLLKKQEKMMDFSASDWDRRRGKKFSKRLRKSRKKLAKYEKKAKKIAKNIGQNKQILAEKMTQLDAEKIQNGKKMVNEAVSSIERRN